MVKYFGLEESGSYFPRFLEIDGNSKIKFHFIKSPILFIILNLFKTPIRILILKKVIEVIDINESNFTIVIFIPNLEIISDKGSNFVAE